MKDDIATWEPSTILIVGAIGLGAIAALFTSVGVGTWAWWNDVTVSRNPFTLWMAIANGEITRDVVWWIGGSAAITSLLVMLALIALRGRRGRRRRGDAAGRLTGKTRDIEPLTLSAVEAKAKRLGVLGDTMGLFIGVAVATGVRLYSSFEDVCTLIAGPRTGKTTSWVVPRILAAPGAVVATSNKRDIVDVTRERRASSTGARTWVFDPQGIADTPQTWWWNPLSYVTNPVTAISLTQTFIDATRKPDQRGNAFFDDAARDVVAAMLLAAAKDGRPLTEVHRWLNDQTDDEPVLLLRRHGFSMMAETLQGMMNLVPETRSGVYGGAAQIMSFLLNDEAMAWIMPSRTLPAFVPEQFVDTNETLYCLSQEGRGSAAPIVTALTVAVTEAAISHARSQPGGRLATPMLIELDEAANVCRWRELPDMYSHFGSRGICVDTLLQSWSQGVSVWGEAGMRKLWSAANIAAYAGGVKERDFLTMLSELIGTHWIDSVNVSTAVSGRSVSTSKNSQQRPIATVADLQSLPAGRAWVFASGATAVLAELIPWWKQQSTKQKGADNAR